MIEIVTDSRENTFRYIINPDGREIELRPRDRNEYINQIIDKEGSDENKRHLFEPLKLINEIKQCHNQHHRIIKEISHIKCFTDDKVRKRMAKPDSRLTIENKLLGSCKYMV